MADERADAARRLGSELRRIRRERGLRQADVARRLHTSASVISRLECAESDRVDLRLVAALLRVYGLELEWGFLNYWRERYGLDDD
jgi:transcriptional regulator with XRE-family HTH domain